MTQSEEERLVSAISEERFQPFLEECEGDRTVALRLYAWEGEAARALQSPLRDLEVSLRNRLHVQLGGRYGREDWWNVGRVRLTSWAMDRIRDAEDDLAERRQSSSAGDVVAKLPFAFWVSLLGKTGNYEMQFWHPSLRHCFRDHRGGRGVLHGQFDRMRTLRNRIAHHERISHRHLDQDFRSAISLLRHLSPEMADLHEKYSQVPQVLARKAKVLSGEEEIRL
ncbi:hypothetical protein AB0L26_12560 [Streptomyces nondiastaticus]|uniref:hypothetical protein n=1 Tax=Streptomyces nondiastaticus TaxID=3154512 RepID=UPI003422E9BF